MAIVFLSPTLVWLTTHKRLVFWGKCSTIYFQCSVFSRSPFYFHMASGGGGDLCSNIKTAPETWSSDAASPVCFSERPCRLPLTHNVEDKSKLSTPLALKSCVSSCRGCRDQACEFLLRVTVLWVLTWSRWRDVQGGWLWRRKWTWHSADQRASFCRFPLLTPQVQLQEKKKKTKITLQ